VDNKENLISEYKKLNNAQGTFNEKYSIIEVIKESSIFKTMLVNRIERENYIVKAIINEKTNMINSIDNLQKLNHPQLPRIIEVIREIDYTYIVYEYIEGLTLDKYFDAVKPDEKKIIDIIMKLCNVVDYLHKNMSNPIIHRDIKPENIIIKNDTVYLIDIETSRIHKKDTDNDTSILGTHGFAPPEQYGYNQTDERSDIYAIGATFYYLITGKKYNSQFNTFDFKGYSKKLINVLIKCLEFNPAKRYKTIQALKIAINTRKKNIKFKFSYIVISILIFFLIYRLINLGIYLRKGELSEEKVKINNKISIVTCTTEINKTIESTSPETTESKSESTRKTEAATTFKETEQTSTSAPTTQKTTAITTTVQPTTNESTEKNETESNNDIIMFKDEAFEDGIKKFLGLNSDDLLNKNELRRISDFGIIGNQVYTNMDNPDVTYTISNPVSYITDYTVNGVDYYNERGDIQSLEDLKHMPDIGLLSLCKQKITDLSGLEVLTELFGLELADNNITELNAISSLNNLETIDLSGNKISDISPLLNLKDKIIAVTLNRNQLTDFNTINQFKSLRWVYLYGNKISSLPEIEIDLEVLHINDNPIDEVSIKNANSTLKYLYIEDTNINDLTKIGNLNSIEEIHISPGQISKSDRDTIYKDVNFIIY
jgi:serine/threonine protein kinase